MNAPFYTFSRTGMSVEELEYHARFSQPRWCVHWDARQYSIGRELARYGFYPGFLPLCANIMHGLSFRQTVPKYLFDSNAPHTFLFPRHFVEAWKSQSKLSASLCVPPFITYRRRKGIKKSADAKGTLVFAAHSSDGIDVLEDIEFFIQTLRNLPDDWKPLAICVHFADVEKGLHQKYLARGFPVYTCGHGEHPAFMDNFYEIVRHFQRTVSSAIGSYSFYSVEMDLPFVKIGKSPAYLVKYDYELKQGVAKAADLSPRHEKIERLFETSEGCITETQRQACIEELALNHTPSRLEVMVYLYKSLLVTLYRRLLSRLRQKAS